MIPKEYNTIKEFQTAFDIVTQTAWDVKELEVYDYMAVKEFDEKNALITAERKGIKQGIEQGIEQGMEKGAKVERLNIAKSLLDILDVETIALKTGLTIDDIENLKHTTIN